MDPPDCPGRLRFGPFVLDTRRVELSRNGVVNFGAPYMSQEWFENRRPYAWTSTPDCSAVSEMSTEYANKKLLNRPAQFAGGDLQGRERSIAVVAPNNLEYQQCVATGLQVIRDAGNEIDLELEYVLDFANVAAQAPSVLAKLKDNDITSVACYCDPLMVLSLAGQASEQNYYPEWLIGGVGFVDIDLVGQFIAASAPDQWRNAFGGSPSTPQAAAGTSEAYRAYKSVRDDEHDTTRLRSSSHGSPAGADAVPPGDYTFHDTGTRDGSLELRP